MTKIENVSKINIEQEIYIWKRSPSFSAPKRVADNLPESAGRVVKKYSEYSRKPLRNLSFVAF